MNKGKDSEYFSYSGQSFVSLPSVSFQNLNKIKPKETGKSRKATSLTAMIELDVEADGDDRMLVNILLVRYKLIRLCNIITIS